MTDGDVTMGELARRLDRLDKRLDALTEKADEARVWFTRILVSAIVFPILVGIVMAVFLGRGHV